MRKQEHMKYVKQLEWQSYTRAGTRQSQTDIHQSALTNHVGQITHTIGWDGVRLTAKEPKYSKKGSIEAIAIQKFGTDMINSDSRRIHLHNSVINILTNAQR